MTMQNDESTSAGILAAAGLAERLLARAEAAAGDVVAKARQQVAAGGRLELAFVFGPTVTVELAVRDDYEVRRVIGHIECKPVRPT